jgi:hypothetical protein
MSRSTNTETLKKKKRLLPQCSRRSSTWKNGEAVPKQPCVGLRLMPLPHNRTHDVWPMPRRLFQKLNLHGTQMKQKAKTTYIDIKGL